MNLADDVRRRLAEVGDPARAVGQQRYIKSAMPFYGVTIPQVRALVGRCVAAGPPTSRAEWEGLIRELWDGATHREERYAALAVARHRVAASWRDPASLGLWRHLVVTGAWWDLVDETAHVVGDVLRRHRAETTPTVLAWSADPDLWLRRAAVICQVGHREATDTDLLRRTVGASLDDPSFWLRKAIGWALRDYARTDPGWVAAFVEEHADRLSGLSRREALKHLPAELRVSRSAHRTRDSAESQG